jgi:mannose-1-phosphate guanylyltransferase/phosphomannomutase
MVMRTLIERLKDRELVLVDGVKVVFDDGWAIIVPDPEEPLTHVWAEGASDSGASDRAREFADGIIRMLQ